MAVGRHPTQVTREIIEVAEIDHLGVKCVSAVPIGLSQKDLDCLWHNLWAKKLAFLGARRAYVGPWCVLQVSSFHIPLAHLKILSFLVLINRMHVIHRLGT